METGMKRIAAVLALGLGALLAAVPANAGSGNRAAIAALATLRYVDRVDVIDTVLNDRFIYSRRAMPNNTPLTPLQVAILNSPPLVQAIRASVWRFDLRSVYAALVEGNTVYIYLGEPPGK
jgi:hypothetical protein